MIQRKPAAYIAAAIGLTAVVGAQTVASAHTSSAFPRTIHSTRLHPTSAGSELKPGTPITAAEIGQHASLGGNAIAGLADRGALFGSVYPALSTDGGSHWAIDGPRFYVAAANGPNVTDHIEAMNANTVIAWGHGGNFVKTTSDRGKHWYAANFPVGVEDAGTFNGHLTVRALGDPNAHGRFPTRRYNSSNDGRTWHRGRKLPPVS